MKNILTSLLFISLSFVSFSQNFNLTDGVTDNTCTGNFLDAGGNGFYTNNENFTYTICSDGGATSTIGINFTGGANYFNVDPTDTLYVYDGSDATAPLIGAYNNTTPIDSVWATGTCLTFVFVSDASAAALGWQAEIDCNIACQSIGYNVTTTPAFAVLAADTGIVELCEGDTLWVDVEGVYLQNGIGYTQDDATSTFSYQFGNSDELSGVGLNTNQFFVIDSDQGNLLNIRITDVNGCTGDPFVVKAQVGPDPDFSLLEHGADNICLGDTVYFIGGVNTTDTVNLIRPLVGSLASGGVVAGTTFLPDGSGAVYSTSISMNAFANGQTVTNPTDIQMICMDIEHSYLGDLEIWLECPNGTEVSIVNSYSPGYLPGGFDGSDAFLGEPIDDDGNLNPGVGYEYCFSTSVATFGTMGDEYSAGNMLASSSFAGTMDPNGIYLPDGNYADFVGCPLNGDWTLYVQDNIGSDNGYIFEWSIILDPSLLPNNEYLVDIDSTYWWNNPNMIAKDDTSLTYVAGTAGPDSVLFTLIDTYGCYHDTIFYFNVIDTPMVNMPADSIICSSGVSFTPEYTYADTYLWSTGATTAGINVASEGFVTVTASNMCGSISDSTDFSFSPAPQVSLPPDDTLCDASDFLIDASYFNDGPSPSILWNTGETTEDITVTTSGDYILTVSNGCAGEAVDDTITLVFIQSPTVDMVSDTTICSDGTSFTPNYSNVENYLWNTGVATPSVYIDSAMTYTVVVDNYCGIDSASVDVSVFLWPAAWMETPDTMPCLEATSSLTIQAGYNSEGPGNNIIWNTGSQATSITVAESGMYTFTVGNGCPGQEASDSISVEFINCQINYPNIFTPNGDGMGDELVFEHLELYNNVHLLIFNRWGNKVYESDNYQNDWRGTLKDTDRKLSSGTYYYVITIPTDNEPIIEKNFIMIVAE